MNPDALPKIQALLGKSPLFRELSPEELMPIAQGTREVHAPKGMILFQKGDLPSGFYWVVFGQVKLTFLSPSGAEKIVEILPAGQTFGEAVMFSQRPYPVYAQTLADSLLLHIPQAAIFGEIERNKSFALKMLAGLSARLHGLVNDVAALSLDTGSQRLVGYLLSHCDQEHVDSNGEHSLRLPAGKAVVASRLNITPETLSRILQDLVTRGLITVNGREITIHRLKDLQAFSC
jgi:CRP-like cAMP-binding protein